MADLAVNTVLKTQPRSGYNSYPIANGITLYPGALVSLEGGYVNHYADGAADVLLGICLGDALGITPGAALTGNTSGTPVPEARVDQSGATIMHIPVAGTATQAKVGDLVYCADSNVGANVTLTIGALNHPIGYLSKFRSVSDCDITLFTPSEMLAQATA